MIKLEKLSKSFGEKKILANVDLTIPDGDFLAVIGPSGSGKSTLLRLLLRLQDPTAGKVLINDQDIALLDEEGLVNMRKKIGMVFQSGALFDSMNIFENVAFALREHTKLPEEEIRKTVREKLRLVELEEAAELMPSELSGGMQKRAGIARAMAFNPEIILYDEPTTGLDPATSLTIENLMIKLSREPRVTSIVVTHVMQTVERVAKNVVLLHDYKFIEAGTPAQVKDSKIPAVRKFVTGEKS